MFSENEIFIHILKISNELTQIKDVDCLLEKILFEARQITNADAGSIYVKDEDELKFKISQNDSLKRSLPAGKKLIFSTFTVPLNTQSISGYVAKTRKMVNIPDAYNLASDLPFFFNKEYDELSNYLTRSILAFPLIGSQNKVLGVLQLINARNQNDEVIPFKKDLEKYLIHFANSASIALERTQLTRAIILRMLRMSEMRDPKETGAHVNRVGAYSAEIYEAWAVKKNISESDMIRNKDILRLAAMLHDVGKVAISDMILKKPARLTKEEFDIMKHHTFLGARLFADKQSAFDEAAFIVALEHHERWDGNGYPGIVSFQKDEQTGQLQISLQKGKKTGEEIHPFSRVVAIADVYDALGSKRVYKDAWEESDILETLKSEAGKQFDPMMIEAFQDVYDVILNIKNQFPG